MSIPPDWLDLNVARFYVLGMQKTAILFFILLSLVMVQAYSQEAAINSPTEHFPVPPEIQARQFAGLRLETYQLNGKAVLTDRSTMDLTSVPHTIMPNISYGWLSHSSSLGEFQTTYGLEASAAYASQDSNLGKLQTNILSLKPMMRFHWRSKHKVYTRVAAEVGYEQLNLLSSNEASASSFSQSAGFIGYGVGLEWDPSEHYGIILDTYSRISTAAEQNNWSPTSSSYQIGAMYFF